MPHERLGQNHGSICLEFTGEVLVPSLLLNYDVDGIPVMPYETQNPLSSPASAAGLGRLSSSLRLPPGPKICST